MDIEGKTMTERVVERVRRAKTIPQIVVAMAVEPGYGQLICPVISLGANYTAVENPSDLIHRHLYAAKLFDADIIVRIPGDNPCVDPGEIDRMVDAYNADPAPWNWLTTNLDANVLDNGYPGGLGCEIYDVRFFEWADKHLTEPRQREHPHRWAMENRKVRTIQAPDAIRKPWLDFSVNTQADLDTIRRLYREAPPDFTAHELVSCCNS